MIDLYLDLDVGFLDAFVLHRHSKKPRLRSSSRFKGFLVCCFLLVAAPAGKAQSPCRDTLVNYSDSICEGESYDFNGRIVSYTGIFFDTLPRVGTDCDSVIVLHLAVLDIPNPVIYSRTYCNDNEGFDLFCATGYGYHLWSSQPPDSDILADPHSPTIHVNPAVPTTYSHYVDYRESPPQCPASDSRLVHPIHPVIAAMHVTPDIVTFDHLQITAEDFSLGSRVYYSDGWSGRNWYINGILQDDYHECATFNVDPSWDDTIVLMMEAYTPSCIDTAIKYIPFHKVALFFPNAFTPSAAANSLFAPVLVGVLDYEIWIFDRRGLLVYHTADGTPWDGTAHGRPCPQGLYVYRCRYREVSTPDGYQTLDGTVTLLR